MSSAKRDTIEVMDDASIAMSLARCRIATGIAAAITPRVATRVMGGSRRSERVAPLFARMLGGRDIALGLGTVIALDRGKPVRGWLKGSALADAVDCVACVLAREHGAMPHAQPNRPNVTQLCRPAGSGNGAACCQAIALAVARC